MWPQQRRTSGLLPAPAPTPPETVILLASLSLALAGPVHSSPQEAPSRPRLVVLLSVDQMIPEQLTRLEPAFSGGFARLLGEGTVFHSATLDYARTETGAGHTTLSTGCLPRSHGIVGNGFFDREAGRFQYCVEDPAVSSVTSGGTVEGKGQRSPRNLSRPTLGEHLQAQIRGAKVVSVSSKDRAAIGMGGRSDGLVLWWDKGGAGFVTSTWYANELPDFVDGWNSGWIERASGWEWAPDLPADVEQLGTAADERPGERSFGGRGVRMPYTLGDGSKPARLAGEVYQTPLTDRFTARMGRTAMRELGLGLDDQTDLLAMSFSGCDVVGHAFGPYSREVTDLLLQLDLELGALFDELDERVGRGRWVAALSADHGVLPLPEHARTLGLPAARVARDEVGAFTRTVSEALSEALGGRVRVYLRDGGLVMDRRDLAKLEVTVGAACDVLVPMVEGLVPSTTWLAGAHDHRAVAALGADELGVSILLRNTYFPGRSPDVVLLQEPGVLLYSSNGTSHGSHHMYDRRVPLVFLGAGVTAASRFDRVGPEDAAPTLLGLIGCEVPEAFDGVDLELR